ncbi:MAG: hypothetical protein U0520_04045 [Candidatus Saccharimonadales bacterium]
MRSAEFTEDFFEECAVVEVLGSRVVLAVLRGENMSLSTQGSKAPNVLPIPDDVVECNEEILTTQTWLEDGEFPRRYVDAASFPVTSIPDLAIGRVVHYHQGRSEGDMRKTAWVCIGPDQLALDEVNAITQEQLQTREELLRRRAADLRSERYYARTRIERLDPGQPFMLFENAEIRHRESGKPFMFIPDRIFVSEKRGPQRLRVAATILTPDDDEYFGWERRYTSNGAELLKELHRPFGDEELGVPMIKVDVYTSSPLGGHKKAREEQKLELTINGERYWSAVDPEYSLFADFEPDHDLLHMTDKGFDDYIEVERQSDGDLLYCDFQVAGRPKPNVFYRAPGSEELVRTGADSPVRVLLPLDLVVLGEIEAEFPGLF